MDKAIISCFAVLMLVASNPLAAQEELPRTAMYVELEGGAAMLQARSMRSDFPIGLQLGLGVDIATGADLRIRFRPQVGVRFFSKHIERNIDEHFRIIGVGGTISYDTYFVGQTSFFPFVSVNYNLVHNYDAETVGHDSEGRPNIERSESYVKGTGFSTALGLKVQRERFFVKGAFDIFEPILRVRYVDEQPREHDDDPQVFLTRYQRESFNLNAFTLTIGYILF